MGEFEIIDKAVKKLQELTGIEVKQRRSIGVIVRLLEAS